MFDTMKSFFAALAVAAVLTVASAQVYRDSNDPRFDVYPYAKIAHHRRARDVKIDPSTGTVTGQYPVGSGNVFGSVQGNEGRFGYRQNIFDNANGKLDGSAYHGRTLGAGGDTSSLGGRLDWTGSRGAASVDVSRFNHGPTSVNAAGGGKWPLGRNADASLQGTYSQTFGHGRPNVGVLGTINGRW